MSESEAADSGCALVKKALTARIGELKLPDRL
jgi:hypothetical protein